MQVDFEYAYPREIEGDGPTNARILVITDSPSYNDKAARRPLSDGYGKLLFNQFLKAGITRSSVRVESICERVCPGKKFFLLDSVEQNYWREDCLNRIKNFNPTVIVPLGEEALRLVTDKTSISKWHLSILPGIRGIKTIPLLSPDYIMKFYKEIPFLTFGALRVTEESKFAELKYVERDFRIVQSVEEAIGVLKSLESVEFLSTDIETAAGQITCLGLSSDPKQAFCIPTNPKDYSPEAFHRLFLAIDSCLQAPSKKVGQNNLYDQTYLSAYGIRLRNFFHDTMACQKFLHPELPMGLDTIARINTREPYWKDEGKDWGARQDINSLYYYNCKDASVTLEAAFAQRVDLEKRGLKHLFYDELVMPLMPMVTEMCWTGLPIDIEEKNRLTVETEKEILEHVTILNSESIRIIGKEINSRSPIQVKELLKTSGYRLPEKRGKESSDKESLLKLRLKDPTSKILTALIKLSELNKRLSSYLNYDFYPDNRLRYMLYNCSTETGRWSGGLDPWDKGINVQTVPSEVKSQFAFKE